jgi:exosortase K
MNNAMVKSMPYALCAAIAYGLKYHYSRASVDDLLWILSPTAGLVEWLSGVSFIYDPSKGFVNAVRGIAIAPACGGVNFLIIAFVMSFFSFGNRYATWKSRVKWLVVSLLLSYAMTLAVNSIRICVSIESITHGFHGGWLTQDRVHRIEGVVINFFVLAVFYTGMEQLTKLHDKSKSMGRAAFTGLKPLFWYLLVALVVPVLTGNYREHGGQFLEHGLMVVVSSFVVLVLLHSIRRLFLPITSGCGIKQ